MVWLAAPRSHETCRWKQPGSERSGCPHSARLAQNSDGPGRVISYRFTGSHVVGHATSSAASQLGVEDRGKGSSEGMRRKGPVYGFAPGWPGRLKSKGNKTATRQNRESETAAGPKERVQQGRGHESGGHGVLINGQHEEPATLHGLAV